MTQEERWHPVFGRLTDTEDIAVFDHQQAREEYEKASQKAWKEEYEKEMEKQYQEQMEKEYQLYQKVYPVIQEFEAIRDYWTAEDVALEAHCSVPDAEYIIKSLNI